MALLQGEAPCGSVPQVLSSARAAQLVHSCPAPDMPVRELGLEPWCSPSGLFSVSFLKNKKKIMLIKWTHHQIDRFNHFKAWISAAFHVFSVMQHHQCFGPDVFMTPKETPGPAPPSPAPEISVPRLCVHSSVMSDCDPWTAALPDSSVHRFSRARIVEWLRFPPPGDLHS